MHYPDKHIRVKFKGRTENIQKFHRVMFMLDKDWPYVGLHRLSSEKQRRCQFCKGLHYRMPKFCAEELVAFGAKFKVGVKIRSMNNETKCMTMPGVGRYFTPPIRGANKVVQA